MNLWHNSFQTVRKLLVHRIHQEENQRKTRKIESLSFVIIIIASCFNNRKGAVKKLLSPHASTIIVCFG